MDVFFPLQVFERRSLDIVRLEFELAPFTCDDVFGFELGGLFRLRLCLPKSCGLVFFKVCLLLW